MNFQSADSDQSDYASREDEVLVFTFSFRQTAVDSCYEMHARVFGASSENTVLDIKRMIQTHTFLLKDL